MDKLWLRCEVEGKAFPNGANLQSYRFLRECFAPTFRFALNQLFSPDCDRIASSILLQISTQALFR
jgi:hypothetical protein